jgi:hypothetical protein
VILFDQRINSPSEPNCTPRCGNLTSEKQRFSDTNETKIAFGIAMLQQDASLIERLSRAA